MFHGGLRYSGQGNSGDLALKSILKQPSVSPRNKDSAISRRVHFGFAEVDPTLLYMQYPKFWARSPRDHGGPVGSHRVDEPHAQYDKADRKPGPGAPDHHQAQHGNEYGYHDQ